MNLFEISEFLHALAIMEDSEDFPANFAEKFLIRTFTHCIMTAGFPDAYLLAISDVSAALVLYAYNEIDRDELWKATFNADVSIQDYEKSQEIDTDFSEDDDTSDDTEEPLEGPDDVIFDDNGEVPF